MKPLRLPWLTLTTEIVSESVSINTPLVTLELRQLISQWTTEFSIVQLFIGITHLSDPLLST